MIFSTIRVMTSILLSTGMQQEQGKTVQLPADPLAQSRSIVQTGPSAAFIAPGAAADAPDGFVALCRRDLALCRGELAQSPPTISLATKPDFSPVGSSSGVVGIDATAAINQTLARPAKRYAQIAAFISYDPHKPMRTLTAINRQVNRQVVQVSDIVSVGVDEEWDRPGRIGRPAGDCEDIAIEKRMRLVEGGFPTDKLFFAVVYKADFGLHTVLIARLDQGDYVLDSAKPGIVAWDHAGYVWLRMQSPGDPLRWTQIATGTRATMTPNPVYVSFTKSWQSG